MLSKVLIYLKSFIFCLKYMPLKQAIKIPILIGNKVNVKIDGKNHFVFPETGIKRGMMRFNIDSGSDGIKTDKKGELILLDNSKLYINDNLYFTYGSSIRAEKEGKIYFGKNIMFNKNFVISSRKQIHIGDDCMFGWNCHVRDFDGHDIIENNNVINPNKDVYIGNHVWCGAECTILKGSRISNDSIIAYKSLVTKPFEESNILIGGHPAVKKRSNINWRD